MSTIPDNESFGDYSASNSNVWIGPSPIQRGHISTSTFRSAGDDIYANRWVNQRKMKALQLQLLQAVLQLQRLTYHL